jgi:ATP-binding cassette subfamily B protein
MKESSTPKFEIASAILPYWKSLFFILVLGAIATLAGLAQPYFTKLLIDDALISRDFSLLVWISLGMLGVTVLSYGLNAWTGYRYIQISAEILFTMRRTVYEHLQRLSPRFYAKTRIGEIVSRLNNDVAEIQRISSDTFLALTTNALFLAGSILLMLYLDFWLSLLTFALMPLTIYGLRHARHHLERETEGVRQRSADLGSFLVETLMGMRTTVLMSREQHEVARFRAANDRFVSALLRRQKAAIAAGMIPSASLSLGTLLVFVVGGYRVITGVMTIGSFIAFMAYQSRMMSPVQNIMTLYTNLAALKVAMKRVMELLDEKPEVADGNAALDSAGTVEFRSVSFRHDRETILRDASFAIPPGTFCVILGSSGAGKSSIADLLVRLYDPDTGSVLLDGRDVRQFRLADLRSAVVLVEQDTFLFNGTIDHNIRYGGDATDASEFLSLPGSTVVGDRGLALSGGEKQAIGIARALARTPQILILDETTSAMDGELEAKVLAEVQRKMVGRTVILITHRTYLAHRADLVLHVENGEVLAEICSKSL